mmetsp:Transcript_6726/g.25241  ORF Transcript_6726/g.25241 Transcript_6726/m.25241 type:complete len:120 (+) Transcript_6726:676-1035(+)
MPTLGSTPSLRGQHVFRERMACPIGCMLVRHGSLRCVCSVAFGLHPTLLLNVHRDLPLKSEEWLRSCRRTSCCFGKVFLVSRALCGTSESLLVAVTPCLPLSAIFQGAESGTRQLCRPR